MKRLISKLVILILIASMVMPYFNIAFFQSVYAVSTNGIRILSHSGNMIVDATPSIIGTGAIGYLKYDYFGDEGLISALDRSSKDIVRAGYDGRKKIESNAYDDTTLIKQKDIKDYYTSSPDEWLKYVNNAWYVPKKFSKIPILDQKIVSALITITDPKVIGGYANYPVNITLNKGYTSDKNDQLYSKENPTAELTDDKDKTVSQHYVGKAADFYAKGQIKCTILVCDDDNDPLDANDPGNNNGKCDDDQGNREILKGYPKPFGAPFDIDFKNILAKDPSKNATNITSASQNGNQNMTSALKMQDNSPKTYFADNSIGQVFKVLVESADLTNKDELANIPSSKIAPNGALMGSVIAMNTFLESLGLSTIFSKQNSSFKEFVQDQGKQILSEDIFKGQLSSESFTGANGIEWLTNIGQSTLEEQLALPGKSLQANDSHTLLTIGQRVMEEILGLESGSLRSSAVNYEELIRQIGQGSIEKNLALPKGSFSSNNPGEIKNAVGEDKYNDIFAPRNMPITAGALSIDSSILSNNLNNPSELKKIVGEKVLDQKIRIFEDYQVKDASDQPINDEITQQPIFLNSRDEMLDLINYRKPEVDFTNSTIKTYDNISGEVNPPYGFNDSSGYTYTYEKLLANLQQNYSLTSKFLKADKLADVYKEIGITRVAKGLSSMEEEQFYIRKFLASGNIPTKIVKYDDKISAEVPAINLQTLAKKIRLYDWFDLYKIFIVSRGQEIYPYLGQEVLSASINDGNAEALQQEVDKTDHSLISYYQTKLSQMEETINLVSDENIKLTLLSHLNNAKIQLEETNNDSLEKVMTKPLEMRLSQVLVNMGKILADPNNKLSSTDEARKILQIIYEINRGSDLPDWHPSTDNLKSALFYGLKTQDAQNLFSGDIKNINIDDITTTLGARALYYGMDMDSTYQENDDIIKNLISNNSSPKEISEKLANMAQVAELLNVSLDIPNVDKFSSYDIAQMLSGNWTVTLNKLADRTIFTGLDISYLDLLKGKVILDDVLPDEVMEQMNVAQNNISNVRSLLGSLSNGTFVSESIRKGINSLTSLIDTSKIQDYGQLNQIISKFNDYLFKGVQSIGMVKDLQNMSETIGQYISESFIKGAGLNTIFKELGSINLLNSIKSQFPDLNINLDLTRIVSGLKLPDLSEINTWIKDNFGDLGDKLNGVYKDLYGLGLVGVLSGKSQTLNYAYLDTMIKNNLDKNIPAGFAQAMLSGDQGAIARVSAQWIKNSIENPTDVEKAALDELANVFSGKLDASKISNSAINILMANKDLKTSLESAGFSAGTLRTLLSGISAGTLDQAQAVSIGRDIVLANLRNNGTSEKDISAVSAAFELFSNGVTVESGTRALMNALSQNDDFKESLKKTGLTTDIINSTISAARDGNIGLSEIASIAKQIAAENMKNKNTSQKDIDSVTAVFDLLANGADSQSITSALTKYALQDKKIRANLENAGLEPESVFSFVGSISSGNVSLKDISNLGKQLANKKLTDQKATTEQKEIINSVFDILGDGDITADKVVHAGFNILSKNENLNNGLKAAGISLNSIETLASSALNGRLDTGQAINLVGDLILKKVEGVQNKVIANQILGVISSGGTINASTLSSLAITAYGDKINALFTGMNLPAGSGTALLQGVASGNLEGAVKGIAGNYVAKELTSAMDNMLKTTTGTTATINSANKALASAADKSKQAVTSLADGKNVNAGKSVIDFKGMAKGMIIGMATSMIMGQMMSFLQDSGLPPEIISAIQNALTAAVNAVLTTGGAAVVPAVIMSVAQDLVSKILGGGQDKIIQEVYCAMDYYPWLQPKANYADIFYWPHTADDKYFPNGQQKQAFSKEVADLIGENLTNIKSPSQYQKKTDTDLYEFKGKPGNIVEKIKSKKMPRAVYLKDTQLASEFLDLQNSITTKDLDILPTQIILPQWKKVDVLPEARNIGQDQKADLGDEILSKFMSQLDDLYGLYELDANTGEELDQIQEGGTMKELLKGDKTRSGAAVTNQILYWTQLTW